MASVKSSEQNVRKSRRTLGVCGGAHMLHDGFTDVIYVLLPIWSQALGLSLVQVGILKSIMSAALAGFQLPAGFLSEKFSARLVLTGGTVLAGIGYILSGFAGGFIGLAIALAIVGMGAAVQHPLSSALVAGAYREGQRRAALGIYNFSGDLGKIIFPTSVAFGVGLAGWQFSSIALGVTGVVGGLLIWLALSRISLPRTSEEVVPENKKVSENEVKGVTLGWGITDPVGFGMLAFAGLLDTGTRYAFLSFLPFLLQEKGAAIESVGFALSLVFVGGAAGKFACGMFAEKFGIIRTVVVTELMTACCIAALIFLPLWPSLLMLPVIGVVLNGTSSVLYGTVSEFVSEHRHARAFALFYTVLLTSGAIAPILFGALGDTMGLEVSFAIIALVAGCIILICPFLSPRIVEPPRV